MPALTDRWTFGGLVLPNRVALAPLAGIGNWFVRLQARRYGAGLVVSEMVSSYAVHYGNERTARELLRIDERERDGGPVSLQLFGSDPEVMRSAAARVAELGVDLIDLNMGCPVPKVCKTGAGAALLDDADRAVALARAAREGSGLPVTVKLRSGRRSGDTSGVRLAHRLVSEAGVCAIGFHPRAAVAGHRGMPDYALAAELARTLDAPVILSGGLDTAQAAREAFEATGVAGLMLARGALGNPWIFEELLGCRSTLPSRAEVLTELGWVIDRATDHFGEERATRYLRRFYPWYLERLALDRADARALQSALQQTSAFVAVRQLLADACDQPDLRADHVAVAACA
jgi:nifR3 family TIM-barrel protein